MKLAYAVTTSKEGIRSTRGGTSSAIRELRNARHDVESVVASLGIKTSLPVPQDHNASNTSDNRETSHDSTGEDDDELKAWS